MSDISEICEVSEADASAKFDEFIHSISSISTKATATTEAPRTATASSNDHFPNMMIMLGSGPPTDVIPAAMKNITTVTPPTATMSIFEPSLLKDDDEDNDDDNNSNSNSNSEPSVDIKNASNVNSGNIITNISSNNNNNNRHIALFQGLPTSMFVGFDEKTMSMTELTDLTDPISIIHETREKPHQRSLLSMDSDTSSENIDDYGSCEDVSLTSHNDSDNNDILEWDQQELRTPLPTQHASHASSSPQSSIAIEDYASATDIIQERDITVEQRSIHSNEHHQRHAQFLYNNAKGAWSWGKGLAIVGGAFGLAENVAQAALGAVGTSLQDVDSNLVEPHVVRPLDDSAILDMASHFVLETTHHFVPSFVKSILQGIWESVHRKRILDDERSSVDSVKHDGSIDSNGDLAPMLVRI